MNAPKKFARFSTSKLIKAIEIEKIKIISFFFVKKKIVLRNNNFYAKIILKNLFKFNSLK